MPDGISWFDKANNEHRWAVPFPADEADITEPKVGSWNQEFGRCCAKLPLTQKTWVKRRIPHLQFGVTLVPQSLAYPITTLV